MLKTTVFINEHNISRGLNHNRVNGTKLLFIVCSLRANYKFLIFVIPKHVPRKVSEESGWNFNVYLILKDQKS